MASEDQPVTQPLKARVQKGRLVLDEPTDLPEGEVVELVPVDEVLANGGDYLDDEERERLHAALPCTQELFSNLFRRRWTASPTIPRSGDQLN